MVGNISNIDFILMFGIALILLWFIEFRWLKSKK